MVTLRIGALTLALMATSDAALAQPTDAHLELFQADGDFAETRVAVLQRGVLLALRDLTGDGAQELIQADGGSMRVRTLTEAGTYAPRPVALPWNATTVGWELADLDGDGRSELIAVSDGKTVTRRTFSKDGGWSAPITLFESEVYLPSGVARVPFAQDIDADGRLDLVTPGPGRFHLRLNRGPDAETTGGIRWSEEIEVRYEPEIDYELGDPDRLSSTFGQSLTVPLFRILDVDGDGQQDLVSEMEDRVAFHLASPEIEAMPTWELDLSELKNDVSASDIDLDDLFSAVSGFAQWSINDLDGKAPNDLIIGSDGTFKVYLGGAAAGPTEKPDQVLKASGNVLRFMVRNVIGDERPDLQVVRGERVSLARLLKYLIIPGQLDFDVFTYECGEDGSFARRPTRRTTLGLRVPRLLGMIDDFEKISDKLEADWDIPARRVDWDGDGEADDVVDARDGKLTVYVDCAPPQQRFEGTTLAKGLDGLVEAVVLRQVDKLSDGGEEVIDLGNIDAFLLAPGKGFRTATEGKSPVATHPLWEGNDDRSIRSVDLDGDGRPDFITVVEAKKEKLYQVQLLVRR